MARLGLTLFGTFQATLDGRPVGGFSSTRARVLLAYLVLERERAHSREGLATRLWPDEADETARNNLRQVINNLRTVLGDRTGEEPFLLATRDALQINPASDWTADVVAFSAHLNAAVAHGHRSLAICSQCVARLRAAVQLYQGEFLAHLALKDSQPLEEWALLRRETYHRQALEALYTMAEHALRWGQHGETLSHAERQLAMEPWREEAHRQAMRALALSGRRAAALRQYQKCQAVLAEEFRAEPAAETQALRRHIERGVALAGRPALHNWPSQVTGFVGREAELQAIGERLAEPGTRLISLVGLGGAGKTRLALKAAEEHGPIFRDGAGFVPLAPVVDPADIPLAIAAALGFPLENPAGPEAALTNHLRTLELVLLLDNCEHLVGRLELVHRLLRNCPGLVVLATSRERLNMAGEWVVEVGGLPAHEEARAVPGAPAGAPAGAAVRLFEERMRQARGSIVPETPIPPGRHALMRQAHATVTLSGSATQSSLQASASEGSRAGVTKEGEAPPGEWEQIVRICELVDGLPLAIEIAAGWTGSLPCAEIADEIEANLHFLSTTQSGVPLGQRSMYAVFEQAWSRLEEDDREVLCQLTVFRGGVRGREAMEVVETLGTLRLRPGDAGTRGRGDGERRRDARRALARLANHALVRVLGERYYVHPLVRQYAQLKMAERGWDADGLRARHARAYAGLMEELADWLRDGRQVEGLQVADREIANVRAAWQWAVEAGEPEIIQRALDGLDGYLDIRSASQEAIGHLAEAAGMLGRLGQAGRANGPRRLLSRVLVHQAMHCYRLDEHETARALCERATDLLGNEEPGALAWHVLGNVTFWQGDVAEARRCFELGLAAAHQAGDGWRAAALTYLLGDCASVQGEHRRAGELYKESLAAYRELGDPRMIAVALSNLGDGRRREMCLDEARALYEESLTIAREVGYQRIIANSLNGLAEVAHDEGKYGEARASYAASLAVCREIMSRSLTNLNLAGLANVACEEGELEEARGLLTEALLLMAEAQHWAVLPAALIGVANLLARGDEGNRRQAARVLQEVVRRGMAWEEYRNRAERLLARLGAERDAEEQSPSLRSGMIRGEGGGGYAAVAAAIRDATGVELPAGAVW